jgi:hydrogenase expression/formation protein HypE
MSDNDKIILAHGGGGELTRRLIEDHIVARLANPFLSPLDDGAVIPVTGENICMTTDAFVVQPLEFPGGDIGRLAVCGTVNDVAVMGARPIALSLALVIEEGLEIAVLDRIIDSIAATAQEAGVQIVTGDTKVVERGRGDGLTVTTTGIGVWDDGCRRPSENYQDGDVIIVSGNIAEHGLAVMCERKGLGLESRLESDVAPLNGLIADLMASGAEIRFMRDPTRGGLAGLVAELAENTGFTVEIEEAQVPISRPVRHTAELLGLDPMAVANEGKIVVIVPESDTDKALDVLKNNDLGHDAAIAGRLVAAEMPLAELITAIGGRRVIQRPYGEDLPRIC